MANFGDVRIDRYAKRVAEEAERQVRKSARGEEGEGKGEKLEEETEGGDTKRKEEDQGREPESEGNKRGRYQVGGSSGSGGAGDWWNTEGFGKSYEPFNPMEFEESNQERGQKRTAEQEPEGQREEKKQEKADRPDMHLGWIHEARGEQESGELRVETLEMGHLLNVT